MGIFDIFDDPPPKQVKAKTLENLSCININEWNDGYTNTGDQVIDFIKNKIETVSYEKFISFLKKRDEYLRITDEVLNNEKVNPMNNLQLKGQINGFFPYPRHFLNLNSEDFDMKSYRVADSAIRYVPEEIGGKGMEKGNFKCLEILTIHDQMNKYPCKNPSRGAGIQFVDLDDDEFELLKPLDNKLRKYKDPKLYDHWYAMWSAIYKEIFKTKKRKQFPINRYQSYTCFGE